MVSLRRIALVVAALAIVHGARGAGQVGAHPLHVSYVEVGYAPPAGALSLKVRVFADDFLAHITGPAGQPMAGQRGSAVAGNRAGSAASIETRGAAYIARTLVLSTKQGRVVPLTWCGWQQAGDMYVICLKATVPGGLKGVKLQNAILMDRFDDQLNILQGSYGGKRHSILFTRKDVTRALD